MRACFKRGSAPCPESALLGPIVCCLLHIASCAEQLADSCRYSNHKIQHVTKMQSVMSSAIWL